MEFCSFKAHTDDHTLISQDLVVKVSDDLMAMTVCMCVFLYFNVFIYYIKYV